MRRAATELFKGRHFEHEIIICVSAVFAVQAKLSATIMRWIQSFAPEFERRWNYSARRQGIL